MTTTKLAQRREELRERIDRLFDLLLLHQTRPNDEYAIYFSGKDSDLDSDGEHGIRSIQPTSLVATDRIVVVYQGYKQWPWPEGDVDEALWDSAVSCFTDALGEHEVDEYAMCTEYQEYRRYTLSDTTDIPALAGQIVAHAMLLHVVFGANWEAIDEQLQALWAEQED